MHIVCAGLMVCDLLIKPVNHDVIQRDTTTADIIDIAMGGDAYNVASSLRRMGLDTTLVSALGNDFFGEYARKQLEENHLLGDKIVSLKEKTARSAVLIDERGGRSFVSQKGACHMLTPDDIGDELLQNSDFLYIGSVGDLPHFSGEALAKLLKKARGMNVKTMLDVTGEVDDDFCHSLEPSFPYLDYFVPSLREGRCLSGTDNELDILRFFKSKGVETVCMKLGERGSCYLQGDHVELVPAIPISVADTTGAGDAFCAGFIAACANGYRRDCCCMAGNYAGAEAAAVIGAQVKLPLFETIAEQLKK